MIDWLDLLAIQGTLKSLLQQHSLKASILWHSAFFMVQLSHRYLITGKTIALTIQTFVSKVMSTLFNMLSRFVIAFLQLTEEETKTQGSQIIGPGFSWSQRWVTSTPPLGALLKEGRLSFPWDLPVEAPPTHIQGKKWWKVDSIPPPGDERPGHRPPPRTPAESLDQTSALSISEPPCLMTENGAVILPITWDWGVDQWCCMYVEDLGPRDPVTAHSW